MTIVDKFERRSIDIRVLRGAHSVPAWVYREMAVHSECGDWVVTVVPTGMKFPCYFTSIENACSFAIDTDRELNDWTQLDQATLNRLHPIVDSLRVAWSGELCVSDPEAASASRKIPATSLCTMNGYGGAP